MACRSTSGMPAQGRNESNGNAGVSMSLFGQTACATTYVPASNVFDAWRGHLSSRDSECLQNPESQVVAETQKRAHPRFVSAGWANTNPRAEHTFGTIGSCPTARTRPRSMKTAWKCCQQYRIHSWIPWKMSSLSCRSARKTSRPHDSRSDRCRNSDPTNRSLDLTMSLC